MEEPTQSGYAERGRISEAMNPQLYAGQALVSNYPRAGIPAAGPTVATNNPGRMSLMMGMCAVLTFCVPVLPCLLGLGAILAGGLGLTRGDRWRSIMGIGLGFLELVIWTTCSLELGPRWSPALYFHDKRPGSLSGGAAE
jgi:hypothetical protein